MAKTQHHLRALIERWMRQEDAGQIAAAEEALVAVFSALPPHRPRAGFVAGVLVRIQPMTAWGRANVLSSGAWKLATAAALLLCGTTPFVLALVIDEVGPRLDVTALVTSLAGLATALLGTLADLVSVWRLCADLAHALSLALTTTHQGLAFLAVTTAVGTLACRLLVSLTSPERSFNYAHTRTL